jgi:hypothetical protein
LAGPSWDVIWDLTWLPGSRDLVLVGIPQGVPKSAAEQLYEVSVEGSETRQITHENSKLSGVRATADGQPLLAVQDQHLETL